METSKGKHVGDLNKKSRGELLDLLHRQTTILSNTKLLASLPDRGAKLKELKSQIERALNDVQNHQDQLSTLFEKLQLNHRHVSNHNVPADSDDDDVTSSPKVNGEPVSTSSDSPTKNALTHESSTASVKQPPHELATQRTHFLPNRNARLPQTKQSQSNPSKTWIETAVTPPPHHFTQAKSLNLAESIELLQKDQKKRQELAEKQAMEALRDRFGMFSSEDQLPTSTTTFQTYREESDGVIDSDDDDKGEED